MGSLEWLATGVFAAITGLGAAAVGNAYGVGAVLMVFVAIAVTVRLWTDNAGSRPERTIVVLPPHPRSESPADPESI